MSGPEADEFLLKVQQAATGRPWYSHAKPVVNIARFTCIYEWLHAFFSHVSVTQLCRARY